MRLCEYFFAFLILGASFEFKLPLQGILVQSKHLYVSRANGNDSWQCTSWTHPCKSISRAVQLVTWGEHIYIDSTNTEHDPYDCVGVNVNRSLSLIGYGFKARVTCNGGHVFIINGSESKLEMRVVLMNLEFHSTPVTFLDSNANIDHCSFSGVRKTPAIVTKLLTKSHLALSVSGLLFKNNSACISVVIDRRVDQTEPRTKVSINVTDTIFRNNKIGSNNALFAVKEAASSAMSLDLIFVNVLFLETVRYQVVGAIFLDLQKASSRIIFNKVSTFDKAENQSGILPMTFCTISSQNVVFTVNNSAFWGRFEQAFKITSQLAVINMENSHLTGFASGKSGGTVYIYSENECKLFVCNCTFMHTSAMLGGGIYVDAPRTLVKIHASHFTMNKANIAGGALYLEGTDWLNLTITNSSFTDTISINDGGAVSAQGRKIYVLIQNSAFLTRNEVPGNAIGGALSFSVDASPPTVKPCTAIPYGISLIVHNSSFVGHVASLGGAVAILTSSSDSENSVTGNVTLSEVVMTSVQAVGHGGGLYVVGLRKLVFNIERSLFKYNQAGGLGGAIYGEGLSQVEIKKSIFESCTSAGPGGALSLSSDLSEGSSVFISSCLFRNDHSNGPGGGGFIHDFHKYKIAHSQFERCSASNAGGGLFLQNQQWHAILPNIISVDHSSFINNSGAPGGGIYISTYSIFELTNSIFHSCNSGASPGGALYVTPVFHSRTRLSSTSFTNCASYGSAGGAVCASISQHSNFSVDGCEFLDNCAPHAPGGAVALSMGVDKLIDPGCIRCNLWRRGQIPITYEQKYRSWEYNNTVVFSNTLFERNAASVGGAIFQENGQTRFRNCTFRENFALTLGGHVATEGESASALFQSCTFLQTLNELKCMGLIFSRTAFIDTTSAGPLVLEDTILDNRILGFSHSTLTVSKGGLVNFGYDNMTRLICGRGCEMELVNFTIKLETKQDCTISLTMLQFNCKACLPGLYSLQRGQTQGLQVVPGFQSCLPCPYGGNCSRSIVSKRNSWGHELETDPPSLSFYLCPLGYCSPPMYRSTQQEYNGCQGNRTGILCGKCKEGYTESLYSSHCKPVHLCKDTWFWPLAVLFISTMALYLVTKPPVFSLLSRHIMWFKNCQGEGQQGQESFDRGYTKIVFYFYQTADLLLVYSSPSDLLQTYYISPIIGLLNFQQTLAGPGNTLCVFSGLTAVTKQLFYVSHVVGTLGMICVFFGIRYGVNKIRGRRAPSFDPYLGATVEVLLLGYSRVVFVSFRLLRCLPIASENRLFLDGNIVCFQPWQYLVVAFVVIFVVPFVFVLTWGSSKFYKKAISAKMFLLSCVFPLPFLLHWALNCCSSQKYNTEDNHQDFKSLQRVLYEPFRISEDGQWVISWESILIGRRFILVVLHAVLTDPVTRLLSLTFSCVLFLLHHNVWQPYRDPKANLAETISLLSLVALAIVNVFFAMFPTLGVVAKGPLLPKLAFCAWLEVVILGLLPSLFVLILLMILMSQGVRALLWGWTSIARCWEYCILGRIKDTQPLLVHPHLNDSVEQEQ